MSARLATLAAVAVAAVAGCGSDGEDGVPDEAPPVVFHEPAVVESLAWVERIRARLTAASDLYAIGEADAARIQFQSARDLWRERSADIVAADEVLAREVHVAFERVERQLEAGTTFDAVRDRLAPLNGQLLDGVREEVAPKEVRLDPSVQASVLVGLLEALRAEYLRGGRTELHHAYGLLVRGQAVARQFAGDLGDRRADVIDALRELRSDAFPDGADPPPSPAAAEDVLRRTEGVADAVRDRFGLPAAG